MGNCYNSAIKIKEKMDNAKYSYVSFSGGKDSTAMLIRLLELGIKIDKIAFADTGFEFPELYEYIDRVEKYIQDNFDKSLKIERLQLPNETWEKWFYGKATRGKLKGQQRGFPLRLFPCYWSRESKIKQLESVFIDAKAIYIGIAYDEQDRIGNDEFIKYPLNEWKWTEQDCVDYLNSKELMNPLYKNYNRLGCFFCQKQSEMSLWILWKTNKELWEKTKYWDKESRKVSYSGHGIKEISIEDYEKKFETGWIPKKEPKYECIKCNAVGSAFEIRQSKLKKYFENQE